MIDLVRLRRAKKEDPGEFMRMINRVFNDSIVQLRKEREKNRRLVAAIRKLTKKR